MSNRVQLNVLVNLDPFQGAFHTTEQARDTIQAILLSRIGHYEPVVTVGDQAAPEMVGFAFDKENQNWCANQEVNRTFIQCQFNWLNDLLFVRGHVFLNELYDALGLPRTPTGAIAGWTKEHKITYAIQKTDSTDDGATLQLAVPLGGVIYNKI